MATAHEHPARGGEGALAPSLPMTEEDAHAVTEGLVEAAASALEALMDSPLGLRHEHLDPEPEEALLALLGHPPDARDGWLDLAVDLRGRMMLDAGLVAAAAAN